MSNGVFRLDCWFRRVCVYEHRGEFHSLASNAFLIRKAENIKFRLPVKLMFGLEILRISKSAFGRLPHSIEDRSAAPCLLGHIPQTPLNEDFIFGGAPDGTYFSS